MSITRKLLLLIGKLNSRGGHERIGKWIWASRVGTGFGAGKERGVEADRLNLDAKGHIWFEKMRISVLIHFRTAFRESILALR